MGACNTVRAGGLHLRRRPDAPGIAPTGEPAVCVALWATGRGASPIHAHPGGPDVASGSGPRARAALQTRPKLQKLYADTFAKNKIVALAFPTTPLPAAPIGDDEKTKLNGQDVPTFPTFIQNTDPGSNAGIPGLTIPIARTQSGLPLGLELDGPAGSDRKLLGIGLALERLFGRLPAP